MKRFLLMGILLCASLTLQAADITGITRAFQTGKAQSLTSMLAEKIDLALPGKTLQCEGERPSRRLTISLANINRSPSRWPITPTNRPTASLWPNSTQKEATIG